MGKMRLSFIDSDLLYRGALEKEAEVRSRIKCIIQYLFLILQLKLV
jgi:hypothetical protein